VKRFLALHGGSWNVSSRLGNLFGDDGLNGESGLEYLASTGQLSLKDGESSVGRAVDFVENVAVAFSADDAKSCQDLAWDPV